jgi:hypothetical protein
MKAEVSKKIEEIMAGMKCPKDFRCAESGFERLCKAEDIGLENHLLCLEDNPFSATSLWFLKQNTSVHARCVCI